MKGKARAAFLRSIAAAKRGGQAAVLALAMRNPLVQIPAACLQLRKDAAQPGGSPTPVGQPHKPAPPPTPLKPCSIKTASIVCSHGRKAQGGILEVVPEGLADLITLSAETVQTCKQHARWVVGGGPQGRVVLQGPTNTFTAGPLEVDPGKCRATAFLRSFLPEYRWLKDLPPDTYTATCETCSGSESFTVRVYPDTAWEASLHFGGNKTQRARPHGRTYYTTPDNTSWMQAVRKLKQDVSALFDHLKKLDKSFGNPEFKWLEGGLSISNRWVEEEHTHLACHEWEVNFGFYPLISADIKFPIPTAQLVSAVLSGGAAEPIAKAIDQHVYVYVGVHGECNAGDTAVFRHGRLHEGGLKAEATVSAMIGFAVDAYILSADAHGETKGIITLDLIGTDTPTLGAHLVGTWEPLNVEVSFELNLFIVKPSYGRSWHVFEKRKAFELTHEFIKA